MQGPPWSNMSTRGTHIFHSSWPEPFWASRATANALELIICTNKRHLEKEGKTLHGFQSSCLKPFVAWGATTNAVELIIYKVKK